MYLNRMHRPLLQTACSANSQLTVHSPKTSVKLYHTIWHHITQDSTHHKSALWESQISHANTLSSKMNILRHKIHTKYANPVTQHIHTLCGYALNNSGTERSSTQHLTGKPFLNLIHKADFLTIFGNHYPRSTFAFSKWIFHQSSRSSWNNLNSERHQVIHKTFLEFSPMYLPLVGKLFFHLFQMSSNSIFTFLHFKGRTVLWLSIPCAMRIQ